MRISELEQLEALYNKAKEQKRTTFSFKGQVILVDYAKYLLEYYDTKRKRIKNKK